MSPLCIPLHGPPTSAGAQYFAKHAKATPDSGGFESALLRSIQAALRGTAHSQVAYSYSASPDDPLGEDELAWNSHTVTLSTGGVLHKKWNFEFEEQAVQYACLGLLEQTSTRNATRSPGHYSSSDAREAFERSTDVSARPTFGPFARVQREHAEEPEKRTLEPTVFVFLRNIGKMFLRNGLEYTFSLPFIVRKAWPLYPHGVMIQRVLEPNEIEEAEFTGDVALPTVFTVTSPFSEAGALAVTSGIIGGFDAPSPAVLKDDDENSRKPLISLPASEVLLWTSNRSSGSTDDVLVTVDADKCQLTVWRYAYVKPKDTPVPLGRHRGDKRKRRSMSGFSRRMSVDESSRESSPLRSESPDYPELPPLSALPGMPPSLSTNMTMTPLGGVSTVPVPKGRRNSLTRNELSMTMDRLVLGEDQLIIPIEVGRMKASFWAEKIFVMNISPNDSFANQTISVSLFDQRWDGKSYRSLMAICLPSSQLMSILSLTRDGERLKASPVAQLPSISATSIRATRDCVCDLLYVDPTHQPIILTHGLYQIPVTFTRPPSMDVVISVSDATRSSVTVGLSSGKRHRTSIPLVPSDPLTLQCLQTLSLVLPVPDSFAVHWKFLEEWSVQKFRTAPGVEFEALEAALCSTFGLTPVSAPSSFTPDAWTRLASSTSHKRFRDDPALQRMRLPHPPLAIMSPVQPGKKPHHLLSPILWALHALGEDARLTIGRFDWLVNLVPLICKIAVGIRPEWADYWKRLYPEAIADWPALATSASISNLDDRIPVWPPDMSAILYGRISNPDWKGAWLDIAQQVHKQFDILPSYAHGRFEPLANLKQLSALYTYLSDSAVPDIQKRAENTIRMMSGEEFVRNLPLGIAAPLREAARTCQLSPPFDWPVEAYKAIGRNDLAVSASEMPETVANDGYRSVKEFISPAFARSTMSGLVQGASTIGIGQPAAASGVELDSEDFTDVRFGHDRRLEEIARMLCSSTISNTRMAERPDLNEAEQAKEHQHQVIRVAERTLALPYGRAMFTFGTVHTISRDAYAIPQYNFGIRIVNHNTLVIPEVGKIPGDCLSWGYFHNGVAAGLRISPTATGVESSWITFNKPAELTPEHAGFLFALGLTGHLKRMLTWHTFGYLTPKHDLTSIGVLLGLAAANVGTGNKHVTKLLAVHTPALLPSPAVDLNVSLMTQAAGLAGVGILYLGTKDRRMAEVCLAQISRKDLVQPDLSNEGRESYTYATALAFGMVMLGKGTSIPADLDLLSRLNVLVHGDGSLYHDDKKSQPIFDINLTSPAASIAIGLMYLKTERQDVADMLAIPETIIALNAIQPHFLRMRTIARSLIMWNSIASTDEWIETKMPKAVSEATIALAEGKPADDALELAYYHIISGCCFVLALRYAGTARQEAYNIIIRYFDMFSRLVYSSLPAFDHKIKRSAIREGLDLISVSLSMVMAGTGELTCFRRLRHAYGMFQHSFRYGIHVNTHMSLGLLFLGGGRYTLGTSDAAVACMVTAFFPRTHHVSGDNKSYLQALRHLWVLAVEPRCLVARDVDTNEVVYLPVKITVKDDTGAVGATHLISPTLIPDLDRLMSIQVDTPRYWPFYLDTANLSRHKDRLLKSQTLYVKRRTAFLSYTEDAKGSRSLFVRSGSSSGEAATLDFPQLTDASLHPASDLSTFISSFSNDMLFLAFADHFSRGGGETDSEQLFHTYCHASLLDAILQDKPQTLQSHLTLYRYRTMSSKSRFFRLRLQDLRFAADFYSKVYDRRFSGRAENNPRLPLIRENTVTGAMYALDTRLDEIRTKPHFLTALGQYARGEGASLQSLGDTSKEMAWYLLRNGVPVSTVLVMLKVLARDAHAQCSGNPPPGGTTDIKALDNGIREVVHATGTKMTSSMGAGWTLRALDEVIEAWK